MELLKILGLGKKKRMMIANALQKGAIIIDVRTSNEFTSGNINGSLNVPLANISKNINKIKSFKKPILLCCASGVRSATATSMLKSHNIECYNAGSWRSI